MNENENITNSPEEGVETKTYTQEEVMELIQRESDKRVTQALKTQQAKFEKRMSEAEKLRGMDEAQRKEYEFEQKLAEFEQQKKEFALTQNKLEATKVLAERKLPTQFVDYIVAEDAETMMDNITRFETLFKACVADAVSSRISAGTPKGSSSGQVGLTREEFRKMSLAQKAELYNTNPSLYKQMTE